MRALRKAQVAVEPARSARCIRAGDHADTNVSRRKRSSAGGDGCRGLHAVKPQLFHGFLTLCNQLFANADASGRGAGCGRLSTGIAGRCILRRGLRHSDRWHRVGVVHGWLSATCGDRGQNYLAPRWARCVGGIDVRAGRSSESKRTPQLGTGGSRQLKLEPAGC